VFTCQFTRAESTNIGFLVQPSLTVWTLYLSLLAFPPGERNILSREADANREYDQHKWRKAKKNLERAKQHSL
jgi:hypothetical protein